MLNQLNDISATMIGIISLAVIAIILVLFFILNFKKGIKKTLFDIAIFVVAIVAAVLLAKPVLSLFDKMFAFSMVFFNIFMFKFGAIDSFNVQVTSINYSNAVSNFESSSIGISDSLKGFLVEVFNNTHIESGKITTLGAIASSTLSYICALIIVAIILFAVLFALLMLAKKFIAKRIKSKANKERLKIVSGIFGVLQGAIVSVCLLVILSSTYIFGVSTDYLASGFESTAVLNAPYQLLVKTENDIYLNTTDFNDRYEKINIKKIEGIYKYSDDNIEVTLTFGPTEVLKTYHDKTNSSTSSDINKYIVANGKVYLYQSSKLFSVFDLGKEDTINYNEIINEVEIKVELKLKTED